MSHRVAFRPEAKAEFTEAIDWYEVQRSGLGNEFAEAVEATIQKLIEYPFAYPVFYKDVRRAPVQRFPYGVFYSSNEEPILVLAIFHSKRNPIEWQRRR